MKVRSIRSRFVFGFVMSAALLMLGVAAPAFAIGNTLVVDCANPPAGGSYVIEPGTGDLAITSTNCSDISVDSVSSGISATVPESSLNTYPGTAVSVMFILNSQAVTVFNVYLASPNVTDLSPLELARTETMTLSATNPQTIDPASQIGNCGMMIGGVGEHPYSTTQVTVTQSGNFTFRVVNTDPSTAMNYISLRPATSTVFPIYDTWFGVYSSFDPANPTQNLIDCNDDRDGFGYVTSPGVMLGPWWSQMNLALTPGTYTLVLSTFDEFDSTSWATNTQGLNQTAFVQLWGLPGAIASNTPVETPTSPPAELASTGVNDSVAPSAIGLGGIGLLAISTVALIRRSRRETGASSS